MIPVSPMYTPLSCVTSPDRHGFPLQREGSGREFRSCFCWYISAQQREITAAFCWTILSSCSAPCQQRRFVVVARVHGYVKVFVFLYPCSSLETPNSLHQTLRPRRHMASPAGRSAACSSQRRSPAARDQPRPAPRRSVLHTSYPRD